VDRVMEIMLEKALDKQQGLPTPYPTSNIIVRIVGEPFVGIVLFSLLIVLKLKSLQYICPAEPYIRLL